MRLMTAQHGHRVNNQNHMQLLSNKLSANQNTRNNQLIGPQSQSLSMHVAGLHQKTQLAPGAQKSLSIGNNAFNNASQGPNAMQTFTALNQHQG
jgi:hypothetical protein